MKKFLTITVAAMLLISLLLASCGGGGVGAPKGSIVGKWVIFEKNGKVSEDEFSKNTVFDFTADGKIIISMEGVAMGDFTYTTEKATGLTHIIIKTKEGDEIYGGFSFEDGGKVLVLKTNDKDKTYPTTIGIEEGYTIEKYKPAATE